MRFETMAIHKDQEPDPLTGAVMPPVYQTSTYRQDAIGKHRGYEYSRTGNPTRAALEKALANLEGGAYGLAFSSGVAATAAVVNIVKKGGHVVAGDDLYGGTYRLLEKVFKPWGLETTYVDANDPRAVQRAFRRNTRLVWIETPTNPLLKVVDIRRLAEAARRRKVPLAVDNTFATPFFQRPLELGADIVVHSTTKYIGGHSDVIGGAVVTSGEELFRQFKFYQNAAGAVPAPWDCWLTLRGIKTLALRMREHEKNAFLVAGYLAEHPRVRRVYYPGLPGHRDHDVAASQMSGFGGMVSFEIKGGRKEVDRLVGRFKIFTLAESLGGVESLVCYPPCMTHAALSAAERRRRGIGDNLVRLSVGIEHGKDLVEDLEQALPPRRTPPARHR